MKHPRIVEVDTFYMPRLMLLLRLNNVVVRNTQCTLTNKQKKRTYNICHLTTTTHSWYACQTIAWSYRPFGQHKQPDCNQHCNSRRDTQANGAKLGTYNQGPHILLNLSGVPRYFQICLSLTRVQITCVRHSSKVGSIGALHFSKIHLWVRTNSLEIAV